MSNQIIDKGYFLFLGIFQLIFEKRIVELEYHDFANGYEYRGGGRVVSKLLGEERGERLGTF